MREYTIHVYGLTFTMLVSRSGAHFAGRPISRAQAASLLHTQRAHHARITRLDLFGGYR